MLSFVYMVLVYLLFNFMLFIRFCSLGMIKEKALIRVFKFPFEIVRLHYNLYKKYKGEGLKESVRLLLYPITNLPNAIVAYTEMYVKSDVFEKAVRELLTELTEEEKVRLIKHLIDQKLIRVKVNNNYDDDDSGINFIPKYTGLEHMLT